MTHDDEREHIARMAAMLDGAAMSRPCLTRRPLDRRSHTMTTNDNPDVRRETIAYDAAGIRLTPYLPPRPVNTPPSAQETAQRAVDPLRETLAWVYAGLHEHGYYPEGPMRSRIRAALAAAPQPAGKYLVGEMTMEHVFRSAGLTNVSDWQRVQDQMEIALATASIPGKDTAVSVLREVIEWCHDQKGTYPGWFDRARKAVGEFTGDPGRPPQPAPVDHGGTRMSERIDTAKTLTKAEKLARAVDPLREALEWYGEQARLCRLIHNEGDSGRHAISNDGGKRARAALAAAPQPAPVDRKRLADLIEDHLELDCNLTDEAMLAVADALIAAGLRLPGANDALQQLADLGQQADQPDEMLAWAVVGKDGSPRLDGLYLYKSNACANMIQKGGDRVARVAIRRVEDEA